jgi:hypothetical protein
MCDIYKNEVYTYNGVKTKYTERMLLFFSCERKSERSLVPAAF